MKTEGIVALMFAVLLIAGISLYFVVKLISADMSGEQEEETGRVCGNGICEIQAGLDDNVSLGDERIHCPQDCVFEETCGDGICQPNENGFFCPADCGEYENMEEGEYVTVSVRPEQTIISV